MSRALLAFAALCLTALPLAGAPLTVADYGERLAAIERRLAEGDWQGARDDARDLSGQMIALENEELAPDLSVLQPLATARTRDEAMAARPRLARLAATLGQPGGPADAGATAAPADRRLLETVRKRQALPEIRAGGGTAPPVSRLENLRRALTELLEPPLRTLAEAFERFWDWLSGLFPKERRASPLGFNLYTLVIVLVAAAVATFAFLAWRAFRQHRRAEPEAAAGVVPAASRDDDPLSRETSEWERYADELARAGRAREAVRAWYHAVLVALYRSGLLHYRRGRTNWEYATALSPALAIRPAFFEMTHRFEREWYGHAESSEEALARARDLALELLQGLRGGRP